MSQYSKGHKPAGLGAITRIRVGLMLAVLCTPLLFGVPALATTLDVEMYVGAWDAKYVEQRVSDFEATHPGIQVKFTLVPNLPERIIVESAGGVHRDVYLMGSIIDRQWRDVLGHRVTLDLLPFIKREKDILLDGFYPPLVKAFTHNDKLVGVPVEVSTQATYINRAIFDEAGVPVPADGWNWNNLLDVAKKLTRDANNDGVPERWGFSADNYGIDYLGASPFLWANGADIVDPPMKRCTLDAPPAVQALQFFYDLHYKYKVAVRPSDGLQWVNFWQGKVAIWESMSWNIAYNREHAERGVNWDIVPSLRSPRTNRSAPVISGDIAAIASTSTHPDLAWEFIKFVYLSDESQQRIARLGMLPPRMEFGDFYVQHLGQPPATIRPVLENAIHGGRTPVWFNDPETDSRVWATIAKGWAETVIDCKRSVDNFVQTITPLVNSMLRK